jgi:crossover junction endodeoxyribonuclease RusA
MMSGINIVLPFPPSVNNYWKKWQNRIVISAEGRKYRQTVVYEVLLQKAGKHFTTPLKMEVEVFRPDKRRRDLDNLLKATQDALCHAGVYDDDCQIHDLRIYWAKEMGGKLRVSITEIENV